MVKVAEGQGQEKRQALFVADLERFSLIFRPRQRFGYKKVCPTAEGAEVSSACLQRDKSPKHPEKC